MYILINKKNNVYTTSEKLDNYNGKIIRKYGVTMTLTSEYASIEECEENGLQLLTKELAEEIKASNGLEPRTSKQASYSMSKKATSKVASMQVNDFTTEEARNAFEMATANNNELEEMAERLKALKEKAKAKKQAEGNFEKQKAKNNAFIIGYAHAQEKKKADMMKQIEALMLELGLTDNNN